MKKLSNIQRTETRRNVWVCIGLGEDAIYIHCEYILCILFSFGLHRISVPLGSISATHQTSQSPAYVYQTTYSAQVNDLHVIFKISLYMDRDMDMSNVPKMYTASVCDTISACILCRIYVCNYYAQS